MPDCLIERLGQQVNPEEYQDCTNQKPVRILLEYYTMMAQKQDY